MVSVSRRKHVLAPSASLRREDVREPPQDGTHPQAEGADDSRRRGRKDKPVQEKPGAGKSTPLGRKVESPASIKTAGPSGQRGGTQHQKQHANK
ncbi:hypothetical protein WG922_00990 [Ramlibacter sp. AN1015]|uniref:hypothetical protein n=1 Tax=Ramlibacter sp. AN1015 TaxID=3133428 RepID=UPI0030C11D6F